MQYGTVTCDERKQTVLYIEDNRRNMSKVDEDVKDKSNESEELVKFRPGSCKKQIVVLTNIDTTEKHGGEEKLSIKHVRNQRRLQPLRVSHLYLRSASFSRRSSQETAKVEEASLKRDSTDGSDCI